jgi:hypothetical protein
MNSIWSNLWSKMLDWMIGSYWFPTYSNRLYWEQLQVLPLNWERWYFDNWSCYLSAVLAFEEPALCRREAGRVAASTRQKALDSFTKMMDTYGHPWARTCPWPPIFSRTVGLSMFELLKPGGWSGSICSWQNFRDLGTLLLGCVCK